MIKYFCDVCRKEIGTEIPRNNQERTVRVDVGFGDKAHEFKAVYVNLAYIRLMTREGSPKASHICNNCQAKALENLAVKILENREVS